jgi:hypothetical protein
MLPKETSQSSYPPRNAIAQRQGPLARELALKVRLVLALKGEGSPVPD